MKIVVTVKLAAALDEGATLRDGAIDPADLEWEVNEWDTVRRRDGRPTQGGRR